MKNEYFFYIVSFLLAVFFIGYVDAQELEEEYCQSLEVYQQESDRQAALEAEIRDLYVFLIQQKKDIAEAEYKANH
ncbi:MAG: hypothetical protein CL926_12065 [Deltaproteobacteria bacterium]|nr:hypothetical protein [Deltaproteobacteria bacterium]|tara:strand:- start:55 stop:282 length:228 start_codon:yes stop_codon:yes gene_type:complete